MLSSLGLAPAVSHHAAGAALIQAPSNAEGTAGRSSRRPPAAPALSPRQLEVLRLAALGLTNDEIGLRLGLALATVRFYCREGRWRLDAGSMREAWVKLGWLQVPA